MAKLLHVIASPRGRESRSLRVSEALLKRFRAEFPGGMVDTLDLFKDDVPPFKGDAAAGDTIVIREVGGTVGDRSLVASTAPHFEPGEKALAEIACGFSHVAAQMASELGVEMMRPAGLKIEHLPDIGSRH